MTLRDLPGFDARTALRLLPGDLLAILGFVVAGESHHSVDPFRYPGQVADTALPFLLGWAVAAVLVGVYAAGVRRSLRRALLAAAGGWLLADLLAQALRATAAFGGDADPVFFLVALSAPLPVLLGWRVVVHYATG